MRIIIRVLTIGLLAVIICTELVAQNNVRQIAIETIFNNPAGFQDEIVKVEGLVTQYIPANANSTAYYLLKGDYGSFIRVNTTAASPETNQKYCVTGVVYVYFNDQGGISKYFISEQSRYDGVCNDLPEIAVSPENLDFGQVEANMSSEKMFTIANIGRADLNLNEISISNNENFEIVRPQSLLIQPGKSLELKIIFTPKEAGNYTGILNISHNASNSLGQVQVMGNSPEGINWLLYVLIGATALFILLLVFLFINRKRDVAEPRPVIKTPVQQPDTPTMPAYTNQISYQTIAIPKSIPGTQKLFPGEFEILTGLDAGKKFRIPGFQNQEGLIVTIGRDNPGKEMAQYHIQLKDNTVGREQARLIYDGQITEFLSLGKTNFSIVDGNELKPQEKIGLANGSVIKLGEVTLKYNL